MSEIQDNRDDDERDLLQLHSQKPHAIFNEPTISKNTNYQNNSCFQPFYESSNSFNLK
jgi:23S rRNA A1618 N6-methylase RlmF